VSRKGISLVLGGYFLAALAVAVLEHLQEPFPQWNLATVSHAVGAAIGLYVLSGILPVIGWAFGRFRAHNAFLPLFVWGLLGVAVGGFSFLGQRFDREQEI
jgi:hypothetical protein